MLWGCCAGYGTKDGCIHGVRVLEWAGTIGAQGVTTGLKIQLLRNDIDHMDNQLNIAIYSPATPPTTSPLNF